MVSREKRRHLRYRISTEIDIHYGDRSITARAIEISLGGLGVLTSTNIPPDTIVRTVIKMSEEVICYGRAVWSISSASGDRSEYRIGFSIEGMSYRGTIERDPPMVEKIIQEVVSVFG